MKYYLLLFLILTQNVWADQVLRNQSGFPVCYQTSKQVYLFEWDDIVQTQNKNVYYFKLSDYIKNTNHQISGCDQYHYIHDVPSEILKPIQEIKNELAAEIFSALQQVKNGGRFYRSESTASDFINKNQNLFQANSPAQISFLRERYGDQFALSLISQWSQTLISDKASCDSLIGSCDYYLCAEQKSPCGLDGYNLGFGFKYCSGSNFKLAGEMETVQGQQWVQNVFQCLQKQSFLNAINNKNKTCESIKQDAFESHPNCYAQAGFCDLKLSEKINIFKLIKSEIFSHTSIEQGLALLNLCHHSNQVKQILQQQLQIGGISEK